LTPQVFSSCTVAQDNGVTSIVVSFDLGPMAQFGKDRAKLFVKNLDGFEAQRADQTWVAAPISDDPTGQTCALNPQEPDPSNWLCLRVEGASTLIGLRLHWRDNRE
jgi:hypothetical protein